MLSKVNKVNQKGPFNLTWVKHHLMPYTTGKD